MAEVARTSYDEIPYSRHPFAFTHPNWLATVAALHGLETPSLAHCRVLELGCASGGNLIPMAAGLPESRFVGIDLSPRQIAEGNEIVTTLGLTNIELKALSILDVDDGFGTFDYIICHGVYSWVPPEVQEGILRVCARHLAANGVAYLSYNTYPGWHLRGVVREMLGYHVRQLDDSGLRVQQARAFLDFLAESVRDPDGVYGRLVKKEAEAIHAESDTYLFHEHLEDVNTPLYFHQFAERAAAVGLQYVSEARPSPLVADVPPAVRHVLEQMAPDRLAGEQYLDFLINRTFRRTLLCPARVALQPSPSWEAVKSLRVSTLVQPENLTPDVTGDGAERFHTAQGGVNLSTNRPLAKAALVELYDVWPRSLPFESLWAGAQKRLGNAHEFPGPGDASSREELARTLLNCYQSQLVELHAHEPSFTLEAGERPIASPLARLLAESGGQVTNLRHRTVDLSDFDRFILQHLDGSRDRAGLIELLADRVSSGVPLRDENDQEVHEPGRVRELLARGVEAALHRLARSSLLVG